MSFIVGSDIFFGNDRLDFLETRLTRPDWLRASCSAQHYFG
jgi:hypothetical protein